MPGDSTSPRVHEILAQALDGTTAGVVVFDTELRFTYVNPTLARMNGLPEAEHLGRPVSEVLPALDAREDVLRQILADGVPREVVPSGHTRLDSHHERRYWHGAYHRIERDSQVVGLVGILLEVTDAREQQREVERARARLAMLNRAATAIGTTLDPDTTCDELARFLVDSLADIATVEVIPPEEQSGRRPPAPGVLRLHRAAMRSLPELRERVSAFGVPGEDIDYQPGSANARCLATRRPVLENLLPDEELSHSAPRPARVAAYRQMGIHSALVIPLSAPGGPVGTVTMIRADSSPGFTEQDVETAQDLADRAAISLDNARRYTHEHHIALSLQRSLLDRPAAPHPGLDIATRYLPAGTSALVGGDWFDTIPLSGGRTLLVIGDVMGHGMEAAVDMSHYSAMLRVLADEALAPHQVLQRLDQLMSKADGRRPATCLLALAEAERGTCAYASAGHLPPAVIDADGRPHLLPVPAGPPLGTGQGGYTTYTGPCGPGRTLLLYTDGLVERRSEDIDQSLRRLTDLRLPPAAGLDHTLDHLLRHLDAEHGEDDIALLAARILPTH